MPSKSWRAATSHDRQHLREHGRAGFWYAAAVLGRMIHLRVQVVNEWQDYADLHAYAAFVCFQAVGVTTRPVGYRCAHATMTFSGATVTDPVFGCGCKPAPIHTA